MITDNFMEESVKSHKMRCRYPKCRIFRLLIWKSYKKQNQHKSTYVLSAVIPLIFSIILLVLRSVAHINTDKELSHTMMGIPYEFWWQTLINQTKSRREQMILEQEDFESNVFVPQLTLAYAPNSTAGIRKLIEGAIRSMSMTPSQISSFADCEELRIRAYSEQFLASICFHNVDESQRGLPLKLSFSILMPSELRHYEDSWIGKSWLVNAPFRTVPSSKVNENANITISDYVREGFLSLQYYICVEYLHIASGNAKIPEVVLLSYAMSSNLYELMSVGVNTPIILLLLGFMFPITIFTKDVVEERAVGLHFALNTNHRVARLQFVVWYLNGVCLLMFTCTVFTFMLKTNWAGHSSFFHKCPWAIMIIFFISYVLSAAAFSILMGVIMGSSKMVVAIVPVYWILASLPLLTGHAVDSNWGYFFVFACSMFLCNVTLCSGLRRILCLEHVSQLNFQQYLLTSFMSGDSNLLLIIGLFYMQALIYMLLALSLDGSMSPCLPRLLKFKPCCLVFARLRKWYKRRKRRKQEQKDKESKLRENMSRRTSELSEMNEQLPKAIILNSAEELPTKETAVADSDGQMMGTPVSSGVSPTIKSPASDSSDDEPFDFSSQRISENKPDHELEIWLSDNEVRHSSNQSEHSTIYYLQQSSTIGNAPDGNDKLVVNPPETEVEETRPVVIELKNVWKKYYKTFAVRNISMKVYQNETVVLLGHNGSGKTTILNMICGVAVPTMGSIQISGHDIVKQPSLAYKHVGLSLHNVNLVSEFTFFEHLIYMCRLRGLTLAQSQDDVTSYMRYMNVQQLKGTLVKQLTTGQKRLLQMLCAFAGRTKIVLLDKPMEGVDAFKRGLFYTFTLRQKYKRTIFITTNFPHVASNLGDRIGLLINGKLHAIGTERNLIRLDKNVYRLTCYLGAQCDFSKLFKYFASHIPSIEIELRKTDLAVFLIEHFDLERLTVLMNSLAKSKKDLHVESYQLKTPNVEHVLLKAMMHQHKSEYIDYTLLNLSTLIRHVEEMQQLRGRAFSLDNIVMFFRHIYVVLRRRCTLDIRSYFMPLMQIFLPSILCAALLSVPHLTKDRQVLYAPTLQLNYFHNSRILLQQKSTLDPVLEASRHYRERISASQTIVDVDRDDDILSSMRLFMVRDNLISDLDFPLAAIFRDDYVEALYNNNFIHSSPISLTVVMDALAAVFVNPSSEISVALEILPFSTLHTADLENGIDCLDWVFKVMICFCFSFVWAMPLLNFGLGRGTPYGRVELIGGMRFSTLSIANFMYGMFKLLLSLIPLNAVMLLFNNVLPLNIHENYEFIYLVLIAGVYVLSLGTLISYWMSEMRLEFVLIILFYAMGILGFVALSEMPNDSPLDIDSVLRIHPFYSLLYNLIYVGNLSEVATVCSDEQSFQTSVYVEHCSGTPNCCVHTPQRYFFWDVLWPTYFQIVLIWNIFYVINFTRTKLKPQKNMDKETRDSNSDSCFDQSVLHFTSRNTRDKTWIKEKIRVRTMERPVIREKALSVENLSVFFATNVVLHRINFLLERYQILSIIGVSGSGKTVLIKSLLGTVEHSTGTIHSYCNPFYQNSGQANCMPLSYCPQDDDVEDALTVTEFVQLVLIIRGLRKINIARQTNNLLKMFDLYESRFHLLPNCSRGVLKRLNIAIALIGYAGVILMDDPFSFLDASSWRKIYSIIETQCETGQAVIYTCSDPRYSDLAHRTAILESSTLCVIGERQELQLEQFAAYFVVDTHITINEIKEMETLTKTRLYSEDKLNYLQVCAIVEHIFPHAIVKSRTRHMVSFWLSSTTYTMSLIMETLQKHSNIFYSYSIQTPSIKQLFGSMVDGQIKFLDVIEDEDSECLHLVE